MAVQKNGQTKKTQTPKTRGTKAGGSSTRKASSSKKQAVKTSVSDYDMYDGGIARDIILIVILAVSILIFISLFGAGGPVGRMVSRVVFGLFGILSYIFPLLLFFGTAFYMANAGTYSMLERKIVGGLIVYIFLCPFVQLVFKGFEKGVTIGAYFTASAESHNGGGVIGGLIVTVFGSLFGTAGAFILTILFLIIGLIVLTQRPILTTIQRKGRESVRNAREVRAEKRRLREEMDAYDEFDEFDDDAEQPKKAKGIFNIPKFTASESDKTDSVTTTEVKTAAESKGTKASPKKKTKTTQTADNTNADVTPIPVLADEAVIEKYDPNVLSADLLGAIKKNGKLAERQVFTASDDFVIPGSDDGTVSGTMLQQADIQENRDPLDVVKEAGEAPVKRRRSTSSAEEVQENVDEVSQIVAAEEEKITKPYVLPSTELLTPGKPNTGDSSDHLVETSKLLQQTFADFGVNVRVIDVSQGPTVTRYELQPEHGVKVSRILSLSDDIKLNLAAADIRIEAPIPGKAAVGIEVPNKENTAVMLRDMFDSEEFRNFKKPLAFAVGKDIGGRPVVADIAKMPHLLIAGATGSGKSVCINTLIMSILYKADPNDVKMIMIDPKVVELKIYDGIPHLLLPVVTDVKKASGTLNWAVQEMTERYQKFAEIPGCRDIDTYNERIKVINENPDVTEKIERMYRIVIIVDELADLMMVAPGDVEDAIVRLTQLARAAGIHVIIATQRPSVNVITGLIKANMPSRIALSVTSGVDSRTILDMNGAEKLLGRGDMLFYPQGYPTPQRVQGAFVSDEDITEVVKFLSSDAGPQVYNADIEQKIASTINHSGGASAGGGDDRDDLFWRAGEFIIEKDKASIGMLQRMFKIGFNRAARIMDQLAEAGVVGPEEGTKPRQILMSLEQLENLKEMGG